ncbi:MAG: hypothetical protein JWM59_3543 [Verrucomicrobiales bacterium]|nr:hypothetical protein [Verrucomicrobiales bacterium]
MKAGRSGPEVSPATASLPLSITNENFSVWLGTLPSSDRPAIVEGLDKAQKLALALKASLLAKL